VTLDAQEEYESKKLWQRVSEAVSTADQQTATQEKFLLEEEQRKLSRERKMKMVDWEPRLFERNLITGSWVYKYADFRPWDPMNDVIQFEHEMIVQTKTRHQTPIVRATSLVCLDDMSTASSRGQHRTRSVRLNASGGVSVRSARFLPRECVGSSSGDDDDVTVTTTLPSNHLTPEDRLADNEACYEADPTCQAALQKCLEPLISAQCENSIKLATLARHIEAVEREVRVSLGGRRTIDLRDLFSIFLALFLMQLVTIWFLRRYD